MPLQSWRPDESIWPIAIINAKERERGRSSRQERERERELKGLKVVNTENENVINIVHLHRMLQFAMLFALAISSAGMATT